MLAGNRTHLDGSGRRGMARPNNYGRRKPRPPLGALWSQIALNFDFFVATLLQPGNEDVTLKALVKPELLFAASQLRQVLRNICSQFGHRDHAIMVSIDV